MRFLFFLVVVWVCVPGLREGIAQTFERPNRVLHLDSWDSYVQLPGGIFDSLEAATVEAWVRWDDWNYFSQWFSFGADEQWRAMGVNHFDRFTTLQFFIYPDNVSPRVLRAETNLALGQWCHMAAVSGPGGMHFYLNGVLLGHNGYEGSFAALGGGTHLYLGKSNWVANFFFNGGLDEVRVWSEMRSQAQIRAGMGQRLRGDEPGLVGLWNFDGAAAADGSPSGHHGHLQEHAHTVSAPFPGAGEIVLPAVVRGTVRGEDGMPRVNAVVRLRNARGDSVSMWTREDGHYALGVFGEGAYTLDVAPKSALMPPQEVQLQAGETLRRHLRPSTGVVARWSAEGDAHDEAGGHHGTLMGGTTFASGVVGQAFHLDGVDDYILVPHTPALNPKGSFSLAAWVFPTADSGNIISKWGAHVERGFEGAYQLKIDPELRIDFYISDDAHQGDIAFIGFESPTRAIVLNTWNHVAAVYDQSTGERRVYVNGTLVARRTESPITLTDSRADFIIGAQIYGTMLPGHTAPFAGRIDEVSVHDRALSKSEIQRLYGARVRARWPAEGNANDATRGGNDGALVHPVAFAPGVVGQAFAFDGQGGYVEFPSPVGHVGMADFTAELWLWRAQQDAGRQPLLVKYRNENNALEVHLDAEGRVQVALSSSGDIRSSTSREVVSAQNWHHLTLVRRGGDLGLYIDGRLDTLQTSSVAVDVVLLAPLLLGGSSWHERSFAGYIDEVVWHNRALAATEILARYQTHMRTWYWHQWSGRLQVGGVGLVGLVALVYSVRYYSQRRAREEERRGREAQLVEERRAREIADAANQAKSAFLANMSHEIRTPMNAILGYAQILRNHPALSPQQQQRAIEAIYTSGDHLLELINDVLDLSKIEAGRMELQPVDFDLAKLVDGLATMFQLRCREKDLGWRAETRGEGWLIHGDQHKLRQVLVNLLGNAVKFTQEGEVVLCVEARGGGEYYFEVRDTGPGIASVQHEEIFEPFNQGILGVPEGGTGLGLAIARRHVELMGGVLQIESTPAQGARFFFALSLPPALGPVVSKDKKRFAQVLRLAADWAPQVLIVDDIETNRALLAQILQGVGAWVRQAASGEEALQAVDSEKPDLVFMDIRMPGMDGIEALRRLRQAHGALPMVAISASVMEHQKEYYLSVGFDAFVDKPFRMEALYACLEEVLGVEYEYAPPESAAAPAVVDFDGMRLPAVVRQQLQEAAQMHNVTKVKRCLEQVRSLGEREDVLAAHLDELVQRFDMEAILKVLEGTADG